LRAKTREYFRIKKTTRRYDSETGKFYVRIEYETAPPEPSECVLGVSEAFGLGVDEAQKFALYDDVELAIGPRDIVYVIQFWIMDEFCSTLDREAKIVAFNVQKLARKLSKAVIAATTHTTDLFEDLAPSMHVHKRFGKEVTVRYYPNEPAKECSLIREMRIEDGSLEDWRALAGFHYRSHRVAGPRKIFRLMRQSLKRSI